LLLAKLAAGLDVDSYSMQPSV